MGRMSQTYIGRVHFPRSTQLDLLKEPYEVFARLTDAHVPGLD
jgi:hypothetical protein